jgi:hypothetical protein
MQRPGYLNVKDAAQRYGVSRAKLHRLIKMGRLRATKDPRDERVTLLRIEEVESLFRFPLNAAQSREFNEAESAGVEPGRITSEWLAQLDALRERISGGKRLPQDSVEIIREEREKRSQQLYQAVFGKHESDTT